MINAHNIVIACLIALGILILLAVNILLQKAKPDAVNSMLKMATLNTLLVVTEIVLGAIIAQPSSGIVDGIENWIVGLQPEQRAAERVGEPVEETSASSAFLPDDSAFPDVSMEMKASTLRDLASDDGLTSELGYVSDPFTGDEGDAEGLLRQLKLDILRNPIVGDMVASGIARDSQTVLDNHPWLLEFVEECDSAFGPDGSLLEKWATTDAETEKRYVSAEYRFWAERLCLMLDEYKNEGVMTLQSKAMWVSYGHAVDGMVRTVMFDSQAETPALVLAMKTATGEITSMLGFDLRDKGLFLYDHSLLTA